MDWTVKILCTVLYNLTIISLQGLCPASRASHDGDIFLSKFLQQRVEASSLCSSARGISLQSVQCANAWQNLK